MSMFMRSFDESYSERLLRELAAAAMDYIAKVPCDPDIFPEQLAAYQRYLGAVEMCKQAGVLPFPAERSCPSRTTAEST